ncbi:glycosyltransferase [Arthrobacter crystallopoietes]|uniref:glycosyltransferase n=1 Tax=Crystallibacter crystallopoietes TaxID=37928 RepID=UPI001ABEE41F|nr:glycosyltransferase family 2 protein [Arthrobacter crystallopoietes]QTG79551.1 glycosyltransferase family 2 protein [Arthrobacter crystallopoietes]
MSGPTITAIVPAYNEEEGIGETLEALLNQSEPFDEIIVANDASTDRTREISLAYGVTVVTPPQNLGSKARAQNFALPFCKTDLVLPVDADTVLAPDYVSLIKEPFADPEVVIAAGCVLTKNSRTMTERGRTIEYMFGFHWHRPIQNAANSPVVCSGCDSAFRRKDLVDFGGFPERTIVEDMDYTWSQQIAGKRAVYVGDAVAYAADPDTMKYLRKQVWRWMAGFFQNVRIHSRELLQKKRMLALWVFLAVWEILTVPLWYVMPLIWLFVFQWTPIVAGAWFFGAEFALLMPPLIYASIRRKISFWHVLMCIPALYVVKAVNFTYAWKALIVELVLFPLGLSKGLHDYEKGRADTPTSDRTAEPLQTVAGARVSASSPGLPARAVGAPDTPAVNPEGIANEGYYQGIQSSPKRLMRASKHSSRRVTGQT